MCRAAPSFAYAEDLKQRVLETYHTECATSPCTRDMRTKSVAPHVFLRAQALIIMSDLRAIYSAHILKFPRDISRIGFTGFKQLKPWYAIKGDRETCLCKWCEKGSGEWCCSRSRKR